MVVFAIMTLSARAAETCSAGKYCSASSGADKGCQNCAAGTGLAAGGTDACPGDGNNPTVCVACPAGQFAAGTGADCAPCAAGKFQDLQAQNACKLCPKGQSQDLTGQTACKNCPTGQYATSAGVNTSCKDCPTGKFHNLSGQFDCLNCPKGKFGSAPATCLGCPAGTIGTQDQECKQCTAGRYTSSAGQATQGAGTTAICTACPVDSFMKMGSTNEATQTNNLATTTVVAGVDCITLSWISKWETWQVVLLFIAIGMVVGFAGIWIVHRFVSPTTRGVVGFIPGARYFIGGGNTESETFNAQPVESTSLNY